MVVSVVFVLTVLAYLVSPPCSSRTRQAAPDAQARARLAAWFDRNAPWLLAVEFTIMLVTGVLAMAHRPLVFTQERNRNRTVSVRPAMATKDVEKEVGRSFARS